MCNRGGSNTPRPTQGNGKSYRVGPDLASLLAELKETGGRGEGMISIELKAARGMPYRLARQGLLSCKLQLTSVAGF